MNKWSYAIAKQIPALAQSQHISIPTPYGEMILDNPKDVQRMVAFLQWIADDNESNGEQVQIDEHGNAVLGESELRNFRYRLRSERARLQLLPEDAAKKCGVALNTWHRYERGTAFPALNTLFKMQQMGADLNYLIMGLRTLSGIERSLLVEWRRLTSGAQDKLYRVIMDFCFMADFGKPIRRQIEADLSKPIKKQVKEQNNGNQ